MLVVLILSREIPLPIRHAGSCPLLPNTKTVSFNAEEVTGQGLVATLLPDGGKSVFMTKVSNIIVPL
jgi:hypothetical protein